LLAAAEEEFAANGASASVADMTRRAGLAKGTFFRHFTTKDDLVVAIVEPHVVALAETAERLASASNAGAALLEFLTEAAAQRQQRDVSALLAATNAERLIAARDRLVGAIERLVERARAARAIRRDITGIDVFLIMCAPIHVVENVRGADPNLWRRYVALMFDGLRPEGAHTLPHPAPEL
jgi:AcrR family transcriptional regulator